MNRLLLKIINIQNNYNMSDLKFAKHLGISRRLWGKTKVGDIPIGISLLKVVTQKYPDLDDDVLSYLRNGTSK